jgi:hypothetical protein
VTIQEMNMTEPVIETPPSESAPVLRLYGAGRDIRTREARRVDRFRKKAFRIGEIPIRPGRRVEVGLDFIRAHFTEIVDNIKRGALRVQSSADTFVDPEELKAILEGRIKVTAFVDDDREEEIESSEGELDELSAKIETLSEILSKAEEPDPVAPKVEEKDFTVAEEPSSASVASITESEDARILAEAGAALEAITAADTDDKLLDALAATLNVPAASAPEVPPVLEVPAELLEAPPVEAPAAAPEPEKAPEAVKPKVALPAAWRARNQKDLLALCKELGIEADKSMSKATLIGLIAEWEKRANA